MEQTTVTHHHSIGTLVFYMADNEIRGSKILGIQIEVSKDDGCPNKVFYRVFNGSYDDYIHEDNVFGSPHDLLVNLEKRFYATEKEKD